MSYAEIDAHLVAPKRFVTLSYLSQVEQADFPALQDTTGLSMPDLSKILRDLEDRGLVEISKERKNRYGTTLVQLTPDGRRTFLNLVATLNRIAGN
ncbi:transcriptional regulator [Tessaracoccus rhinocerotis]|uniref:Transcriptional regulator n=1 Tax=Tessaracoccus rhinocerotis TaxID=1689449 RepID=A0A553K213_9ACTN|nr:MULTISPECIES: transcriptional regulator [Actinomycetes]PBB09697.1 transcriptional regulator [Kocuria sp. WRN011]TRY18729.1 transcriptional regulator [Tessaracoccus rhinocerotis]